MTTLQRATSRNQSKLGVSPWLNQSLATCGLAAILLSLPQAAPAQSQGSSSKNEPITKGQRVFTCGHSFHMFVYPLVEEMAKSAGIADHQSVGKSGIGGSRVVQHWDVPDDQNEVKAALKAAKVDVLTLAPIWIVPQPGLPLGVPRKKGEKDPNTNEVYRLPDDGIEKFAKLGVEHNPNIRITVQEYWLPNEEYVPVYPAQTRKKVDHDAANPEALAKVWDGYFHDVEEYVRNLNKQLGKEVLFIVPVGQATLKLREKIVKGEVPGLKQQSELYRDNLGHPTVPLTVLSGYCHFAVIYRRSPVGLPFNPTLAKSQAQNPGWDEKLDRLLQEIAWDAVVHHPMSGVKP